MASGVIYLLMACVFMLACYFMARCRPASVLLYKISVVYLSLPSTRVKGKYASQQVRTRPYSSHYGMLSQKVRSFKILRMAKIPAPLYPPQCVRCTLAGVRQRALKFVLVAKRGSGGSRCFGAKPRP